MMCEARQNENPDCVEEKQVEVSQVFCGSRSPAGGPRCNRAILVMLALIVGALGWLRGANELRAAPNIVIIMADDMGYSDLGCFGGEILTPRLDQLAAGGLRFTNFYSENMCWVSRAALLTGIGHKTSTVNSTIHPRCVTLPEVLRQHNYQTRMSGKWHLAGKRSTIYPNDRGFDEFYGILGGAASFFAPFSLSRNRVNVEQEARDDPDYYFTDAISSEAVRMVQTADPKKPLFLYVAYTAAHWPLHARESDIKAYRGKYAMGWDKMRQQRLVRMKSLGILPQDLQLSPRNPNVPPWEATDNQAWQQRRMEVYAAQVTAMDRGIGRLVDSLEQTGRLENTLVFFTIDNGGCHVEYGQTRKGTFLPEKTRDGRPVRPGNLPSIMPGPEDTYQSYGYGWANASNTPYRMFKQYDHEGGIRTPMIAHWPRGIKKQGSLVQGVSHLIDILPTVMEVTGGKVPVKWQGKPTIGRDGLSLAAAFRDETLPNTRTLFFSHNKGRALRQGNWKLVSRDRKPWELYDLSQDPLELRDLSEKEPARRDRLIRQWGKESRRYAAQAKLK
jgi:arylsulfatase